MKKEAEVFDRYYSNFPKEKKPKTIISGLRSGSTNLEHQNFALKSVQVIKGKRQ